MALTESGIYYPEPSSPIDVQGDMQQMAESIDSSLGGPSAGVQRAAVQSIPNGITGASILWDITNYSRGGAIASAAGIQVPLTGLYDISAIFGLTTLTADNYIQGAINGASSGAFVFGRCGVDTSGAAFTVVSGASRVACTAGNILTMAVIHGGASARNTAVLPRRCALTVSWAGAE